MRSAGHLAETTYPTHVGNAVLAGHVNLPDGSDGPFASIGQLQWGDEIILRLDGTSYRYAVRAAYTTDPSNMQIIEDKDGYIWLTLITCAQYDEKTTAFARRVIVEAILLP